MNFSDTSHNNPDPFNLQKYKASGRDRIVIKATERTTFTDPKFVERFNEAGSLGLGRLTYHFARCGNNGAKEFDHYLSVLKKSDFDYHNDDWMILDVEDKDTPGYLQKARQNAIAFTRAAAEAGFQNGLIYSYRRYLSDVGLVANDLPPGWRRLWIATYTVGLDDDKVALPPGWSRDQVVARQYTDKASVPGLTGDIDDNRVIIEWMNKRQQPPVGDWWNSVDEATAQKTMENAVKKVFRISDQMALAQGTDRNDNFFASTTKTLQTDHNTLNEIKEIIDSIDVDADKDAIVTKIEEVKSIVSNATTVVP